MTKQELYDLAVTKFDIVQPLNEWSLRSTVMGVTRYDVMVFKSDVGFSTYTVFVEDDNGPAENAFIPKDPLSDPPAQPVPFAVSAESFLDGKVTDGTIFGYIKEKVGKETMEVSVYRDNAGVVVRETYVVYLNANKDLTFRKVG